MDKNISQKELNEVIDKIKLGSHLVSNVINKTVPIANEFVKSFGATLLQGLDSTNVQAKDKPNNSPAFKIEPETNIYKELNFSRISINLPGVSKENIRLDIINDSIVIEAEVNKKWKHQKDKTYRKIIQMNENVIKNKLNIVWIDSILYIEYEHLPNNSYRIILD